MGAKEMVNAIAGKRRNYFPHILVANNDILFHPAAIDTMVDRMNQGDVVLVSADDKSSQIPEPDSIFDYVVDDFAEVQRPDFACFMITENTIQQIGWFDERF